MTALSTIAVETLAGGATGALCGFLSSTADQLQMSERSRAGHARGARYVQALVAGYQKQDWSALCGAGFLRDDLPNLLKTCPGLRGSGLSHSRSARGHLPRLSRSGSVCSLAQTRTYSVRSAGCTRPRAQSLAHKQVIQAVAYGPHLSRLSSSVAFAGFNTSEATDGRVPNTAGAFQKTEGELPNVGS